MKPSEKRAKNKLIMQQLKKADFLTIVCVCCVIAAQQYKAKPFISVDYEINNN